MRTHRLLGFGTSESSSQRTFRRSQREHKLSCESLESRNLLAVVQWIGGSGDWNAGTNWSNGQGPGPGDDVIINVAGDVTVTHASGSHTVASITAGDTLTLAGGTLRVTGIVSGSGPYEFSGGTLEDATIAAGTTVTNVNAFAKTLKNATILGTFDMATHASSLTLEGDLTLHGQFLLGNANGGTGGSMVRTTSNMAIVGAGDLVFGGNVGNDFGCLGIGLITEISEQISVRGASGKLGSPFCPVLNHGTIHADTVGDGLTVHFADTGFASTGTLRVSAGTLTLDGNWAAGATQIDGGTLNLKGQFSTSSFGVYQRAANGTAGTVNILGTLLNGVTLSDTFGSWFLKGGTLSGGVLNVVQGSSAELISTDFGGTLSGVDIRGGLDLETPPTFGKSVLLNNQTILNQTLRLNAARMAVDGILNGSGSILFGGSASSLSCGSSLSMTLGPSITVHGQRGTVGAFNCNLVNQGTIHADSVDSGLTVDYSNTTTPSPGTMRVSAGLLTVNGNHWTSGLTEVLGGTLELLGTINQQSVSSVRRGGHGTAGRINLRATLTGGLTLDDHLGSMYLVQGTLVGGELDVAPGSNARLIATDSTGTFSGVTIRAGLNMEVPFVGFGGTSVLLKDQSTLHQTLQLGGANGEGTSRLIVDGDLNGTGTIVFGNVAGSSVSCSGNLVMNIGPGITIRGSQGTVSSFGCNTTIQGTIQAEAGGSIRVESVGNYANGVLTGGTWRALDGSTLRIDGAQLTTLAADVTLDGLGSRIIRNASGDSALTSLSTIASGGKLALRHGVDLTLSSNLANSGTVAVGPESTLTINGSLSQAASSHLAIEIGGTPGSGKHGTIVTSGVATLTGSTLDVRLVDGFGPTSGLTYTSMTFGGRNGDFATRNLLLGAVPMFSTSYSASNLLISTIANAPNLTFQSVQPPANAHVGDFIAIPYAVRNASSTAAPGGGRDAIYLSLDGTLGPDDILLGSVEQTTTLAGNATRTSALTAPLPRIPSGNYRVLVVVDADSTTPDLTRDDNMGVSVSTVQISIETNPLFFNQRTVGFFATGWSIDRWTFTGVAGQQVRLDAIAAAPNEAAFTLTGPGGFVGFSALSSDSDFVDLPTSGVYTLEVVSVSGVGASNYAFQLNETSQTLLPLETNYAGSLAGTGVAQMFQVTLPGTDPLQVRFDGAVGTDKVEVYAKFGTPPNRQSYDVRHTQNGADHVLQIPVGVPGKLFVLVYAQQVPAPSTFTLRVDRTPVIVGDVSPSSISAGTPSELTVRGLGFVPGLTVELIPTGGGPAIAGSDVKVLASDKISVLFNLPQATTGSFDVRVKLPNGSNNTRQAGVTVQQGFAKLETRIIASLVPCCGTATLYVEYANTGTATMPAPILSLSLADPVNPADTERPYFSLDPAIVVEGFWTSAIPDGFSDTVQFLASGESIGWLQPGERILMPVYYIGMQPPRERFDLLFDLVVDSIEAGDSTLIPWSELETELRPTSISSEAWPAIFSNLQTQAGATWNTYRQMLFDNATYLGRLGQRVSDASRLLAFEFLQASGFDPTGSIESATDTRVSAPGVALEFSRTFANSISARYQLGPMGRGWSSDWYRSLETLIDGTVILHRSPDLQTRFQPDRRTPGAFLNETGNTSTLRRLSNGSYELAETDGLLTGFRSDGRLDRVRDANNNTITANYANNRLTTLTHSSGDLLTMAYNAAGRLISVTDSRGRVTSYAYDASNTHLVSVTGIGGTTSYEYSLGKSAASEHALTAITDPTGVKRIFEYDESGRLLATSLLNGVERMTRAYDSAGQITLTELDGAQTRLYFDSIGLLARVEDSSGFYVNTHYDSEYRPVQFTDALGRTETRAYSKTNSLQLITDATFQEILFASGGPRNQPKSFTDALGNLTNYTFDARGNVIATTYSDATVERTTFDTQGNPDFMTNRRGQTVDISVNSAGQVTREQRADGTVVDYTYDARGRLASAIDSEGTTTLSYDLTDRLTRIEYPGARWLQYQYDAAGRRTRLADHTGHFTQYTYDSVGRLQTARGPGNALLMLYTYDAAGRVAREDKGNGTFTEYTYDSSGRATIVTHHAPDGSISAKIDYHYDLAGRVSTMTTLDGMWTHTYDLNDQLIQAAFASTTAEISSQNHYYEYDAIGNRVRTIVNGATTEYVANPMNQIVSAGATSYSYDLDGNLLHESGPAGTRQYGYDSLNRLISVVTPQESWQYEYDTLGNRSAVVHNGQRTEYLIDPLGLGEVVAEFSSTGTLTARYTRGVDLVSRADTSGATSFYDFDLLGNTVQLTGTGGAIQNTYAYQPFGESLRSTGSTANPLTYVGQFGVMEEGHGLYFMRARYFSPVLGRFTQQDPIRLNSGDPNLYRYVENNSPSNVDPSGLVAKNRCFFTDDHNEDEIIRQHMRVAVVIFSTGPIGAPLIPPLRPPSSGCFGSPLPRLPKMPVPFGPISRGTRCAKGERTLCGPPVPIVTSLDPNEKFGAAGFGPQAFIDGETPIPYSVHFENLGPGSKPTPTQPATAPAQRIEITDQLSSNVDWSAFEFTEFGFGDTKVTVQATNYYFTSIPVTQNGEDFSVDVELTFDASAGQIRVVFQALDPETTLPPDALLGVLPPEDGTGNGQGYFNYQVLPKTDLPTGTEIRNIALITFDANAVIATNQIDPQNPAAGTSPQREALNTIDAQPPTSSVLGLAPTMTTADFLVSWSGVDDAGGSGIATYDVWVSVDDGPYTLWKDDTTETIALYSGFDGQRYAFYSLATDNVGRTEPNPLQADTFTVVQVADSLTVTVLSVNPHSRLEPVSQITIVFNAPVTGFDRGDLSLSRFVDSATELSLDTATLASVDGRIWILTGIASLTTASGFYELSLKAIGTGIVDDQGRNPANRASTSWSMNPGDANRDGLFSSSDLVQVFVMGEYEDASTNNSIWSDGDWNLDGEFTSADLVIAFQSGGYESPIGARPVPAEIEPGRSFTVVNVEMAFDQFGAEPTDDWFSKVALQSPLWSPAAHKSRRPDGTIPASLDGCLKAALKTRGRRQPTFEQLD